jgi:hypothetical protein
MSETKCHECDRFTDHRRAICRGEREGMAVDGPNSVNAYRAMWGLTPLGHEWDVSMPSRGLGDVVAKFTHATGLDVVAKAISTSTGKPCGCRKRQDQLNAAVPFKSEDTTA